MKRSLFKILTIAICIVTMLNVVLPSVNYVVYADDTNTTEAQKEETRATEGYESGFGQIMDGIAGLLTWPLRMLILAFGYAVRLVIGGIASIAGGEFNLNISPNDILFDKLEITDVNFFNFDNSLSDGVLTIRKNIAIWYYALRNLAIGILLAILIYVGIRMAISTVADEKAKYQKMLIAWVKGFCMIFVLIYIIMIAINISNGIVELVPKSTENLEKTLMYGNGTIQNPQKDSIADKMATLKGWNYVAICILYWVIVYYQLKFFILYFKRVLSVGFLIIISPLISITYPIDSIGDEKAQGYQRWLKEILINIFIQPLHLVLYSIFITSAGAIATVAPLFAAIFLVGLSRGEKIVKNIFGIRGAQSISSLGGIHLMHRA